MPKPKPRSANVADAPRAKSSGRRDRPLVVDDVEHQRGLVRRREHHRGVEVGLGRGALADPRRGDRACRRAIADAIAHPTACTYCVARLPEIVKNPYSFDEYITGSWRPFIGSAAFDRTWFIMSTSGYPAAISRPCWR